MSLYLRAALLTLLAGLLACADGSVPTDGPDTAPTLSPRPRPELVEVLRQDVSAERHPSDGGGRAWLEEAESSPQPVEAGSTGRFVIVFEAGPLGVARNGTVFLQASAFWGWSPPQDLDPDLPGYTEVTTQAENFEVSTTTYGDNLLAVQIQERPMEPGERLRFVYGAGPAGARVDHYAEQASRIWIAVDGDGDGVRGLVPDSPTVAISAADPARLVLRQPSISRPGERIRLTVAVVDLLGNAGRAVRMTVRLTSVPDGLELPRTLELVPADGGSSVVEVATPTTGVFRILAETDGGLRGESNPLFVTPKLPRVLWADLHGHSSLSDGTQTPQGYFRYARDVAGLDVVALTDHDHWGMQPIALHPPLWESIRRATAQFHEPHRFVTLLGYEWTNWLHGHRHVLYFTDQGEVFSSLDRDYEHPSQLWAALRGLPALTFAHHSAGEPIPTNWTIRPDPELEPVTEIVSVHGSSEAMDSPGLIRGALAGNFARDALDRGYQLGFIGSGDSHDGHPGLAGLASPSSGLAALVTEDLTREGVRAALKARRVYATNGPRILLHVTLDGRPMGSQSDGDVDPGSSHELIAMILTEKPISRVDIVRSGSIEESISITDDRILFRLEETVPALAAGEYLYVRVLQIDGGAAWSSPFFGPPDSTRDTKSGR